MIGIHPCSENRYELAHEAFVRYVREDPELFARYREAHKEIARAALAKHSGKWNEADPMEETDLYDLRHTLTHLREVGDTQAEEALLADEGYASACFSAEVLAYERARYRIAVDLCDQALQVYRYLVQVKGPQELAKDLAGTLNNRANALGDQGKLDEAVRDLDEAVRIRRHLVEAEERKGLSEELAVALNDRAGVLWRHGKLDEALEDLGKVVGIYRHVVEVEEREDLADTLASARLTKALTLESAQELPKALYWYGEAIGGREFYLRAGMTHLTPQVLQTIRYRMMMLLQR